MSTQELDPGALRMALVVFEAAKCICSLKTTNAKDLTPAILGVPGPSRVHFFRVR